MRFFCCCGANLSTKEVKPSAVLQEEALNLYDEGATENKPLTLTHEEKVSLSPEERLEALLKLNVFQILCAYQSTFNSLLQLDSATLSQYAPAISAELDNHIDDDWYNAVMKSFNALMLLLLTMQKQDLSDQDRNPLANLLYNIERNDQLLLLLFVSWLKPTLEATQATFSSNKALIHSYWEKNKQQVQNR